MPALKIVALGSSFAAGLGIPPQIDSQAMRSGRNYAHIVAEQLGAELTDKTSSGATLKHVLSEAQTFVFGGSLPPQIQGLAADADIVMLTAGGNDLGYSAGMIMDTIATYLGPLRGLFRSQQPQTAAINLEELVDRLSDVIQAVHNQAPQAKILLVEYLNVFGASTIPGEHILLDRNHIDHYREQSRMLTRAYRQAAASNPYTDIIRMSDWSESHEVGTDSPWVTGFSVSMLFQRIAPYHPNAAGHEAVASIILEHLRNSRKE